MAIPWPGQHPAPQLVMVRSGGKLGGKTDAAFKLVQEFILGHKFHGFHVPLEWELPEGELLLLCDLADGLGFHIHFWVYGDADHGSAPTSLGSDKGHYAAVARLLAPYKNISVGIGYDLHECPTAMATGSTRPFWIVNPSRTAIPVSPELKLNARPDPSQSMMQLSGPLALRTVISLPPKSRSRLPGPVYVSSATTTVSPSKAASIPAWIVGWSAGTLIVSARDAGARERDRTRAGRAAVR